MIRVKSKNEFNKKQAFTYPPLIERDGSRRRCGSTTRRIDFFIQELFAIGVVKVSDHHSSRHADLDIWRRILDRLNREHPSDEIVACKETFEIKLLNPKSFENIQEQRPDMLNRKNPIWI